MTLKVWQLAALMAALTVAIVFGAGTLLSAGTPSSSPPAPTVTPEAQQSAVAPQQALAEAQANVAAAIPAIDAWAADHNGYVGLTLPDLQADYSAGVKNVAIPLATATDYCVESVVGTVAATKHGPSGSIESGRCS